VARYVASPGNPVLSRVFRRFRENPKANRSSRETIVASIVGRFPKVSAGRRRIIAEDDDFVVPRLVKSLRDILEEEEEERGMAVHARRRSWHMLYRVRYIFLGEHHAVAGHVSPWATIFITNRSADRG